MMPMPPTSRLDAGDGAEQRGQRAGGARHGRGDLGHVAHLRSRRRRRARCGGARAGAPRSGSLHLGRRACRRAPTRRSLAMSVLPAMRRWNGEQRHEHQVVLVLAEAGLALGLEQCRSRGRRACRRRTLCPIGSCVAEQLLAHRRADDAHAACPALASPSVKLRPAARWPAAHVEEVAVRAGDAACASCGCRRRPAAARLAAGADRDDAADLARDGLGVLEVEGPAPASTPPPAAEGAGMHDEQVRRPAWRCRLSPCAVAPSPSVTSAITAPTPMTMPSMVRNERSVLRRISRSAMTGSRA